MLILVLLILLYSIIYLTVFVLAHQDANMIKPLSKMTVGMLLLLLITALACMLNGYWYFSIIIFCVMIGLLNFYFYLNKY